MAKKAQTKRAGRGSAKGLSVAAYAAHRKAEGLPGTSRSTVQNALNTGRIKRNRFGKIDPAQADADWRKNTRERADKPLRKSAPTAQEAVEAAAAEVGKKTTRPRVIPDYGTSRAEREFWNARLAELQVEKEEGRLILAEDAKRDGYRLGRTIRDRVLAIPDRVSPELAALDDPRAVARRLDDELREALTALANLEDDEDRGTA